MMSATRDAKIQANLGWFRAALLLQTKPLTSWHAQQSVHEDENTVTRAPALVEQLVFHARLAKLCFPATALLVMLSRIKAGGRSASAKYAMQEVYIANMRKYAMQEVYIARRAEATERRLPHRTVRWPLQPPGTLTSPPMHD